MHSEKPDFD